MLATDASNDRTMLGHNVVGQDRRACLEDISSYIFHGALQEEDGRAREEEEQTMRCKEEEEEAKLRERRGGTATGGAPCLARAASMDKELTDCQRAAER
jgi:hypothetical protein